MSNLKKVTIQGPVCSICKAHGVKDKATHYVQGKRPSNKFKGGFAPYRFAACRTHAESHTTDELKAADPTLRKYTIETGRKHAEEAAKARQLRAARKVAIENAKERKEKSETMKAAWMKAKSEKPKAKAAPRKAKEVKAEISPKLPADIQALFQLVSGASIGKFKAS